MRGQRGAKPNIPLGYWPSSADGTFSSYGRDEEPWRQLGVPGTAG